MSHFVASFSSIIIIFKAIRYGCNRVSANTHSGTRSDRLESWKAIAKYLQRDVRTVQRWEADEALPIHRHEHNKRATVYAFAEEIDAWRETRHADPGSSRNPYKLWAAAGLLIGVPAIWLILSSIELSSDSGREIVDEPDVSPSIAVLPFDYPPGDDRLAYFSAGITDDVINLLATSPDIRVTSRTSSFYLAGQGLDLPEIASRLDVGMVLEGHVRTEGDELRINANLIDGETNTLVRSFRFDSSTNDVLEVQFDIARAVAEQLHLDEVDSLESRKWRTRDARAEQLYLRARFESRKRTADSLRLSIALLQQAIDLDPDFAAAYAELAAAHMVLPGYSQRAEDRFSVRFPQAMTIAQKALELDPGLGKPWAMLAGRSAFSTDFVGARKRFERALELTPGDSEVRIWYGMLLSSVGDGDGAFEQYRRAHQLDPLSGMANRFVGIELRRMGRPVEAVEFLDVAIALDDVNALYDRALAHIDQGEFESAEARLSEWSRAHGIDTEWASAYVKARARPEARPAAIEWINRLAPLHRDIGVTTLAEIGAIDEAFAAAKIHVARNSATFAIGFGRPEMKNFRSDPRFVALARDVGFVDYWNEFGWQGYCSPPESEPSCR
ncbi:MAG: hypothetical protein P8172_01495 [Gammaproteobacteria bacterium]|jgi:TolB-like protein/Flp pilus assembly protein TadD